MTRLAEFVRPQEPSTAELRLEWHEVRRRVRRTQQVRAAGLALAGLLLLGVVGLTVTRANRELLEPGAHAEARTAARTLWLKEGSQVSLTPDTAVALATAREDEVVIELEHGAATFDVERRPSRRFVVKADQVEVRVIGTKFTVQRVGREVDVTVERGVVEVRDGAEVSRLTAGKRWARPVVEAALAVPPEVAPEVTEDVAQPEAVAMPEEPAHSDAPVQRKSPGPKHGASRPSREPAGPSAGGSALAPAPEPTTPVAQEDVPAEPTPADSFSAAMRARGAGRAREAMRGFQQVCERWPSSAFAPMASFEWGRLALDEAGDARQAARAFERTLELATSAQLIDDALARLAEAYGKFDVASCRRVQAESLRRFPGGPHARTVTEACPRRE